MIAVQMAAPVAHFTAVSKRPKLSLNTSELPTPYGKSSRGLSTLATPTAAVTPTTINTFTNTYELTHRPSPTSATVSPAAVRSVARNRLSRSQSPRPQRPEATYTVNLPYGIRPILKNAPVSHRKTNSVAVSPRGTTKRVFFPAPKQVSFANPIEEEVVTKVYTARHYDLLSNSSGSELEETETDDDTSVSASRTNDGTSTVSISSSTQRKCRRDSVDLIGSKDKKLQQPHTPSSSRSCRKWEWTLAPLSGVQPGSRTVTEVVSSSNSSTPSIPESVSGSAMRPTESQTSTISHSYAHSPVSDSALAPAMTSGPTSIPSFNPLRTSSTTSRSRSLSPRTDISVIPTQPQPSGVQHPQPLPSPPETPKLPLSPTHQAPIQRRALSLDSLPTGPRKRKAECLDNTNIASSTTDCGRVGAKRRERAATL